MFLHDKNIQVSSCLAKKYYNLRHLGSRAYLFKFFVSYHIFRHVEIWNMYCILNHLGIEKKILSFNSVLDKFTHIISKFHISQAPVQIPSPSIGDLYISPSHLRMCSALKKNSFIPKENSKKNNLIIF